MSGLPQWSFSDLWIVLPAAWMPNKLSDFHSISLFKQKKVWGHGLSSEPPLYHFCLFVLFFFQEYNQSNHSNSAQIWNTHSPHFHLKGFYFTFPYPTLTFPFSWLSGLEVDLFCRLPVLMEWLYLSWLPLTRSPWLHRAMVLLCQDKVKDHSKPCTGPCSTFNQTSAHSTDSERVHACSTDWRKAKEEWREVTAEDTNEGG